MQLAKKKVFISVAVLTAVMITLIKIVLIFLISVCVFSFTLFVDSLNGPDVYLMTSQSPDGTYTLEAYQTNPHATVDFSIKVYSINGDRKELIYFVYHESEASISWINDDTVSVNGKSLNLANNEKYFKRT